MRGVWKKFVSTIVAATLVVGCASNQATPPQNASDAKTVNANGTGSASSTSGQDPASESADSNKLTRYAGWIIGAVGVQSAIFAVATSFMMLHENGVRSSDCNAQKICTSDGVDANNKLGLMGAFNATSWVVAAAGLGVGAYLVITNPPKNDASTLPPMQNNAPSASIGVGPEGSGVGLNFRSLF